MEYRTEIVNGKPRKVIERKGRLYIREAIEFPLEHYVHGTRKALELGGKNFTDLSRELLAGFCGSMGFGKDDVYVKDAGNLFDRRLSRHIQTAVYRCLEEIGQCKVDASTN